MWPLVVGYYIWTDINSYSSLYHILWLLTFKVPILEKLGVWRACGPCILYASDWVIDLHRDWLYWTNPTRLEQKAMRALHLDLDSPIARATKLMTLLPVIRDLEIFLITWTYGATNFPFFYLKISTLQKLSCLNSKRIICSLPPLSTTHTWLEQPI